MKTINIIALAIITTISGGFAFAHSPDNAVKKAVQVPVSTVAQQALEVEKRAKQLAQQMIQETGMNALPVESFVSQRFVPATFPQLNQSQVSALGYHGGCFDGGDIDLYGVDGNIQTTPGLGVPTPVGSGNAKQRALDTLADPDYISTLPAPHVGQRQAHFQHQRRRYVNLARVLDSYKRSAQLYARSGNLERGIYLYYRGLNIVASAVSPRHRFPMPYTHLAAIGARDIATVIINSTRSANLGWFLTPKIQYQKLEFLVNKVLWAYQNLDKQYFPGVQRVCRTRECFGQIPGFNPAELDVDLSETFDTAYYTNAQVLAQEFLQFQINNNAGMANNIVELKVGRVVTKVARALLKNTMFKRDYSCIRREMRRLEHYISRTLSCTDLNINYAINDVRRRMFFIQDAIKSVDDSQVCTGYLQ